MNCKSCTEVGKCDSNQCADGYGPNSVSGVCEPCAAHCLKCEKVDSGTGKCNSDGCDTNGFIYNAADKLCKGWFTILLLGPTPHSNK